MIEHSRKTLVPLSQAAQSCGAVEGVEFILGKILTEGQVRGEGKRTAGINKEVLLEREDRMGAVPPTAEVGMGISK